jgi:4-diphosphocytidyl-2-C-methyl-D-erythritol kinase
MLNTKFELRLSDDQLSAYALRLGSDCPFFLVNKPCLGSSRGEVLEPLDLDLDLYRIVLINPRIHVHTAYAFSQVTPSIPAKRIREIIQQPVREWRETLKNDFEDAIFKQYPEIQKIKEELYGQGALYASMSGSGSTVYGIFEKEKTAKLNFPAHYFVRELVGQAQ